MWGCYKQAQHYVMGQMTGPTSLVAKWQIMTQNILGSAQDFKFLEVPIAISGIAIYTKAAAKKQKPKANTPNLSALQEENPNYGYTS